MLLTRACSWWSTRHLSLSCKTFLPRDPRLYNYSSQYSYAADLPAGSCYRRTGRAGRGHRWFQNDLCHTRTSVTKYTPFAKLYTWTKLSISMKPPKDVSIELDNGLVLLVITWQILYLIPRFWTLKSDFNDNIHVTGIGIILFMRPGNERWRYIVTQSLIGWAHTQIDPWRQHRWLSWRQYPVPPMTTK